MAWANYNGTTSQSGFKLTEAPQFTVLYLKNSNFDELLNIPYAVSDPVNRLVELDPNGYAVAVGTSPDFPVQPKWRKVVRQIG